MTAEPRPTIWQAGLDASFLANLVAMVVVGAAAALAYRSLFRASRVSRRDAA